MRFQVTRTSQGAISKKPPCRGASRGPESPAWPGEFVWYLELKGLEELIQFLNDHEGGLALHKPEPDEDCPVIEILDEE